MKPTTKEMLQVDTLVNGVKMDYPYKGPLTAITAMAILGLQKVIAGQGVDFSGALIGVCAVGVIVFLSAIVQDAMSNG